MLVFDRGRERFCYRVAAVNTSGAGPFSQSACAQPGGVVGKTFRRGDVDASQAIDISDAVNSLSYQFLGGPPPATPGPDTCGADPAGTFLGCETACP